MMGLMGISDSLVVGADGSTTHAKGSAGVSSAHDRADFLARRQGFDCIIIGGTTARSEPYSKTPVPLVIISRQSSHPVPENPHAHLWNLSITDAITAARKGFGESIHIEAGVSILNELLSTNAIDDFYLTMTPAVGGSNIFDWKSALEGFEFCAMREIDGTKFYHASKLESGN